VVVYGVAIAVLGSLAQVNHRTGQPVVGGVAEAEPAVVWGWLAASSLGDDLVA
jgi:hypothetical protein